jgi:hypothetical protein
MSSVPQLPPGRPTPWNRGVVAVYHITQFRNFASIAAGGVLRCDNDCKVNGVQFVSIAYDDLKARRTNWPVHVGPRGTLADYVPFYFAPRSPMLYAIAGGWVAGYSGGQVEVAHLVFSLRDIARAGEFVITDGHAATPLTDQFDDLAGLERIDWSIMREKYWRDTDEDGDRKRRRQAELLVVGSVPFSAVKQIGVMTTAVAEEVRETLVGAAHQPPVVVRRDWYY